MITFEILTGSFPSDELDRFPTQEAELVQDVANRNDTASILIREDGALSAYAVIGFDAAEMVTVYAARSIDSLIGRAAFKGIFGAAQVMGKPLRVHTEKLRAMARFIGAEKAFECLDSDLIKMGVFDGVAV